jgi:hypothetical protein
MSARKGKIDGSRFHHFAFLAYFNVYPRRRPPSLFAKRNAAPLKRRNRNRRALFSAKSRKKRPGAPNANRSRRYNIRGCFVDASFRRAFDDAFSAKLTIFDKISDRSRRRRFDGSGATVAIPFVSIGRDFRARN